MLLHTLWDCIAALGVLAFLAVVIVVVGCLVLSNDEANGENPFE